ncbi:hypothetical protein [Mycoplasma sp. ATU-Cv-508]|uniref:hypothetical protein n=1 Tax=Mycoplasma sp. ATU-Cv-508 TaxID=2048001 RepID=UPI0031F300FC
MNAQTRLSSERLVFDTAFHQSLDERRFLYPIPRYLFEKHLVRKYGMHGIITSTTCTAFVRRAKLTVRVWLFFTLGNGSSVCAIKDGKSVNTSMGLTPLAGLMMGTRSGDIDPAVAIFLQRQLKPRLPSSRWFAQPSIWSFGDERIYQWHARDWEGHRWGSAQGRARVWNVRRPLSQLLQRLSERTWQPNWRNYFTGGIGKNSLKVLRRFVEKVSVSKLVLETQIDLFGPKWVKVSTRASQFAIYASETDEEIEIARQGLELIGLRQPLIGRQDYE